MTRSGAAQVAAPLVALLDVVLGLLELVLDEVERGTIGEVADREDRAEHLLEADQLALGRRNAHLQERVVGLPLHLDQVRHLGDFGNAAEALAIRFLAVVRSDMMTRFGCPGRTRRRGVVAWAR